MTGVLIFFAGASFGAILIAGAVKLDCYEERLMDSWRGNLANREREEVMDEFDGAEQDSWTRVSTLPNAVVLAQATESESEKSGGGRSDPPPPFNWEEA